MSSVYRLLSAVQRSLLVAAIIIVATFKDMTKVREMAKNRDQDAKINDVNPRRERVVFAASCRSARSVSLSHQVNESRMRLDL